uniref:Uncharacterized protein n=1 Tax=Hyaloperonospora arabidopsidis (strain Emoy2) TaxID=559515 RepID=M4BU19_HYAAE
MTTQTTNRSRFTRRSWPEVSWKSQRADNIVKLDVAATGLLPGHASCYLDKSCSLSSSMTTTVDHITLARSEHPTNDGRAPQWAACANPVVLCKRHLHNWWSFSIQRKELQLKSARKSRNCCHFCQKGIAKSLEYDKLQHKKKSSPLHALSMTHPHRQSYPSPDQGKRSGVLNPHTIHILIKGNISNLPKGK